MNASKIELSIILFHTIVDFVYGQIQPVKIDITSNGYALKASFYSCAATRPGPVVRLLRLF
jgi:hypothetical protein